VHGGLTTLASSRGPTAARAVAVQLMYYYGHEPAVLRGLYEAFDPTGAVDRQRNHGKAGIAHAAFGSGAGDRALR
jgi:hypothetical protein